MELSKILMDLYDKANNGGSGGISAEEQNGVIFMTPTSFDAGTFGDYVVFDIKCGNVIECPMFVPGGDLVDQGFGFEGWIDPNTSQLVTFPFQPSGTQILEADFSQPE